MKFTPINLLNISLEFSDKNKIFVGKLGLKNRNIYFEYDNEFLKTDIEISPFKLKTSKGLIQSNLRIFHGLFGVFNDSLPDGWGRLLIDRKLKKNSILPESLTPLDRLSIVGKNAIGALTYEPEIEQEKIKLTNLSLDSLNQKISKILEQDEYFEEIYKLNGSSAGARPKALIALSKNKEKIIEGTENIPANFENWLVKFSNSNDSKYSGIIEYIYSIIAKEIGIEMPDTHLFEAKTNPGFFAIKRFDRNHKKRKHVISACGLLESDFRIPSLDYKDLIKACHILTKDIREVKKLYKLAVFNIMAHNKDDHSKNFSFIMDEKEKWKFAPAYDLTFSGGPGGEQSMLLCGKGKNFTKNDFLELANLSGIEENEAQEIITKTSEGLKKWPKYAKNFCLKPSQIKLIKDRHLLF